MNGPPLPCVQEKVVVVGDIGGTNSRLGMWRADPKTKEAEEIFHTVGVRQCLAQRGLSPQTLIPLWING